MRYLVFAGDDYYPSGGMWDPKFRCDTIEEVRAFLATPIYGTKKWDWHNVLDLENPEEKGFQV